MINKLLALTVGVLTATVALCIFGADAGPVLIVAGLITLAWSMFL